MTYSWGAAVVINSLRGRSSVREFLRIFLSGWLAGFKLSWDLGPCFAGGFFWFNECAWPWWPWLCSLELWDATVFDWFTFVLPMWDFADWFELFTVLEWDTATLALAGPLDCGGKDDLTLTFGWPWEGFKLTFDFILEAVDKSERYINII